MKKLIAYINDLPQDQRESFAESCSTSIGYLRKAASLSQTLGPALCLAIERATGGAVTRRDLRPDDYWLIWPDLPAPTPTAEVA